MKDFDTTLKKNKANYVPLNPVSFLRKTAATFPSKNSIIYNNRTYTWLETYIRCKRLASALVMRGLEPGDTVGFVAMNTPELYEAHFGVPMAGLILNAMNYRLDPKTLAFIIDHSETKLLVADLEFLPVVEKALAMSHESPEIIVIEDIEAGFENTSKYEHYEELLYNGDPDYYEFMIQDEWDTISINYTSGTTGNPKGVAYHYRGAYLNAIGNVLEWDMDSHPVYLWTLPMFHCNGWCFPWTIAAKAGTNVCLRKVSAKQMYASIAQNKVDHLCGAPIVLSMLADASEKEKMTFNHLCKVMTAAATTTSFSFRSNARARISRYSCLWLD